MTNMLRIPSALLVLSSLISPPALAQMPVRTASVERQMMQQRHAVTGSLRAVSRGELAALESGRLLELAVREGEEVTKGDVLARVDARRLEAQKREALADKRVAEADLESQRATADRAEADYTRSRMLIEHRAVSKAELDASRASARVAQANIEATKRRIERIEETVELLNVRLSDTIVRAPYDATVVERHVEPGTWVQPGDALLTLVSTGPIEAWLEVPERHVKALDQFGDTVVVRPRATGAPTTILSTRRVADVNRRVRTLSFIATLSNESGLLAPGMSVDGWIAVTGEVMATSVPKDAVIRGRGEPFVYRVTGESGEQAAERVRVRVLFETGDRIAIESVSLTPGDQVIIEGNERLLPGQPVAVTQRELGDTSSSIVAKR